MLRRGDSASEDMLAIPDLGESVEARIRRYHAFTGRAYGIHPPPEGVRVTRLLAVAEEDRASLALGSVLEATFARRQRAVSARPTTEGGSGPTRVRVFRAEALRVGTPGKGPALVILPGASAFVPEGTAYHVDRYGNLIMETGLADRGN
jgi:N-methylhydantoinase A/oxoprolinase/acetone carboxylase beta subunit